MNYMDSFEWLLCPVCNSKTRIKLRLDTELKNFPLFCPKCKQETLISVEKFKILVITEPDAQTHRRRADNPLALRRGLSALLFSAAVN